MPSNLEFVSILANEVFAKDNTILKPGADILALAPAIVRPTGRGIWDSLGDHKTFVAGEGNIDKVRGSLGPIFAMGATRDMINAHFEVEGASFLVLNAPVTEFGIITPMAGHEAEVENILIKLAASLNESERVAIGDVFAPIVEKGLNFF